MLHDNKTRRPEGYDPTGGEWCDECQRPHQAREREVPCLRCRRMTFAYHAVCKWCAPLTAQHKAQAR